MNTRWLETGLFSFLPAGKEDGWNETDWRTGWCFHWLCTEPFFFFAAWKRETWIIFFAFWIGRERRRLRQRRHLPENNVENKGERTREKETLDRTNNVGLISLWYSLFSTITLQMFLFFCTYIFKNFASVKLLWYESRHRTYTHNAWIHCCRRNERWHFDIF